jgi:hypothetical protein
MNTRYTGVAHTLAATALASGHRVCLRVVSQSMRPLIQAGDMVWVEAVDLKRLRRGDVVVVRRGERLITHRLVDMERGRQRWYTMGDTCRSPDAPVSDDALLGRVVAIDQTTRPHQPRRELGNWWQVGRSRLRGYYGWLVVWLHRARRRIGTWRPQPVPDDHIDEMMR